MECIKKIDECCVILPQDIWIEILLRLPVKCLARAKCVSKSWLSLISDPSFARSHYDLALAPSHRLLIPSRDYGGIVSIDFNAPSLHDYSMQLLQHSGLEITGTIIFGSCRGFLLFLVDPDLYMIWNPCTGIQTIIPSPPFPGNGYIRGFGYDSSTDDYLVTLGRIDQSVVHSVLRGGIFSVRANTWKQFDDIILDLFNRRRFYSVAGLFFNGAIHWIADCSMDSSVVEDVVNVIVAFDLRERVCFEIPFPNPFYGNIKECELRVIGGLLSICQTIEYDADHPDDEYEIYVMEEYKVQSSWKSLFLFSALKPALLLEADLYPLCLTAGGDILGIDYYFTELVQFNSKQVLERCDFNEPYPKFRRPWDVFMHTQSLLSLPCPNSQAEEINHDN